MATRLTGLVAAAYTPFLPDGRLNLACIDSMAEQFVSTGISAAFVCGTTGECHSLTAAERRNVAARWVAAAGARLKVVVHVGHNSLPEAQSLAAHAQEIGAAAISAMSPFFFRPSNVDELAAWCAEIAAAAPSLPFYFYDIPSMTGVRLATGEFLERAAERIPSLAGVKFTSTDLMVYQECAAAAEGRFDILYGHDEMLLAALACGARGAIGSTYNYAAPIYHRLLKAFEQGDLPSARRAQLESVRLVRALQAPGVVRGGKAIMAMLGIDCGGVRLPLAPVSREEARRLYESLREMPVFSGRLRAP